MVLVEALHEELAMHVVGPRFLAFQGAVDCVNAAKDAAAGCGVAAKSVCAGLIRRGAIRAFETEPQAEDVPQDQQDQDLETVGASQRVPC